MAVRWTAIWPMSMLQGNDSLNPKGSFFVQATRSHIDSDVASEQMGLAASQQKLHLEDASLKRLMPDSQRNCSSWERMADAS